MHNLAVIMPTRNRPCIAAQNLLKVHAQFPDAPIYVFDDASDDAVAVAMAMAAVPRSKLIRSEKNIGPAGARRRLIEMADARWCLAIDDDCHPRGDFDPSRWIMTEPGPQSNDPIAVSFRYIRSYDNEIAPPGELDVGPARGLLGGASLLHRASIIAIGNYNEGYMFGCEDTDLARRVWASGQQLWIDPDNFIIHDHVAAGRNIKREAFYYTRNCVLLNVMSLPIWYGLPLGLAQAVKRWLTEPNRLHGFLGVIAGLAAIFRNYNRRRPLTIEGYRRLERLPS